MCKQNSRAPQAWEEHDVKREVTERENCGKNGEARLVGEASDGDSVALHSRYYCSGAK